MSFPIDELPRLAADFKKQFEFLDQQMLLLRPIAQKLVLALGAHQGYGTGSDIANQTPEMLIKSYAMNANRSLPREDWNIGDDFDDSIEESKDSIANAATDEYTKSKWMGGLMRLAKAPQNSSGDDLNSSGSLASVASKKLTKKPTLHRKGTEKAAAQSKDAKNASLSHASFKDEDFTLPDDICSPESRHNKLDYKDEISVSQNFIAPAVGRKATEPSRKWNTSSQYSMDSSCTSSNEYIAPMRQLAGRQSAAASSPRSRKPSIIARVNMDNSLPGSAESLKSKRTRKSSVFNPSALSNVQTAELKASKKSFSSGLVAITSESIKADCSVVSIHIKTESNKDVASTRSDMLGPKYLDAGKLPSSSPGSQARASFWKGVLHSATTMQKWTSKGSLVSSLDTKEKDQADFQSGAVAAGSSQSQLNDAFVLWNTGINPLSMFSVFFEVFISLLYISNLWIVPFCIAFEIQLPFEYSTLLTVSYLLDSAVYLLTLKASHPAMQSLSHPTLNMWRRYYLRHGFAIDLLTSFPFELLPITEAPYLFIIRLLRLYKLPLIFMTSPVYIKTLKMMQNALGIGQTVAVIFPLTFWFCIFLHIQACALFLIGRLTGFQNGELLIIQDKTILEKYTWGLFSAVGNTFPMTYKPQIAEDQWVVLAFVTTGAGFYACIVGAISSLAMGLDASGRLYRQKLDEVQEYMRWKDLLPSTRRKMLRYYELKYRGKFFEERTLLEEMNDSLRMEIATHNCRELISKVSFLRRAQHDGRDDLFVGRIATALTACYFVPGDVIITQGEMGNEMYFMMSGVVDIIANGKKVTSFRDGAFFGEIALIANIPRTATVQAATSSMLYKLTRDAFTSILEEFDDVRRRVEVIYRERMEKIRLEEEQRKLEAAQELASKVTYLSRKENDGRDELFLKRIASSLVVSFFAAEDVVFAQGEMGHEMYFVKNGSVNIVVAGRTVATLSDGGFFGEVALIANIPRTATVVAATPCMMYKLTRPAFMGILEEFDDMKGKIEAVYQERMRRVRREEEERKNGGSSG
ncbi:hypothetical protein HDU80_008011 [Chytriomyces hyalinus]|nr:hypothetical protein HDU80_008011 [Chytriomyces hyalinus]